MKKILLSPKDIRQIKAAGISPAGVEKQLAAYRQGAGCLKLNRHCSVGDGIIFVSPGQRKKLIDLYESEAGGHKLIKFVPASGAASRMFSGWFSASEKGGFGSAELNRKFFRDLQKLPFFPLIAGSKAGGKLLKRKDVKGLLEFILGKDGLNYGNLPKALIPFHRYPEGVLRTPLAEHLAEATGYAADAAGNVNLHFTLSAEHRPAVTKYLQEILAGYENVYREKYNITLSDQSASTNTITVDANNQPLRDAKGRLVFRPGGHGTLLKNLNDLDADLIFVRNIDNIAPEVLSRKAVPFRKMLGGMALRIQKENFAFLRALEEEKTNSLRIDEIVRYCADVLYIKFPRGFIRLSGKEKSRIVFSLLNRPLRICGMVKNDGEPGGGPFWVEEKNGAQTLQIVESGHVDKKDSGQQSIWLQSRYFNPVDMVCCIRNYRGKKFVLDKYVDKDAYLITTKNEKGKTFKALEMPGLWNGGMAYWNTVFVELPLTVFNPVKTVYDLLRSEHITTF
ncbi:MAG: hypothetical protein A4E71_01255 [Smithella sp. PtaU1.Bin162]|nr:MAG: hypothetical protein A4E71_01255 [Smithella sp. PtaU1.Bin162]